MPYRCSIAVLLLCLCPWALGSGLAPGDAGLRHAIAILSDAGILMAPVTTWPLSTGDLEALVEMDDIALSLAPSCRRVLAALDAHGQATFELAGQSRSTTLRGFSTSPREEAEARIGFDRHTQRYGLKIRLARVSEPSDDRPWRADGSEFGVRLGNWWMGASAADRWWGPGWDGSLILSSNARPVPALVLRRHNARPFESTWLRFIGPWTTQVIWGQLEGDRDRGNARLTGWRIGMRPHRRLELGLSRTSQWCGNGRPCDASTFVDLLSGVRDNRGENVSIEDEPGNQLAGFDLRFTFDALSRPWAFYGQRIGEDERDGLPGANITLVGLATWGAAASGNGFRTHLEYANTACGDFTGGDANFGCAYNHSIYTDGYRYRGRAVGHSQDGDGRTLSAGLTLTRGTGANWQASLKRGELNRDSRERNSAASIATDILDIELTHSRPVASGLLKMGIGAEQRKALAQSSTWYGRAFLSFELSLKGTRPSR